MNKQKYVVYGLGIGPGDPELITLKALRLLKKADILVYPLVENAQNTFAYNIIQHYINPRQQTYPLRIPLSSDHNTDYHVQKIVQWAQDGKRVVILCQGDPLLYGSFMYLLSFLSNCVSIEVVPGINAFSASSAVLCQPLVARNDVLTVLPAHLPTQQLKNHLQITDNAAILKLGKHFTQVQQVLEELSLTTYATYIEYATLSKQRILALKDVVPCDVPYFSLILLHKPHTIAQNILKS